MKALGFDRVSKSEVSRICGERDPLAEAFRTRPRDRRRRLEDRAFWTAFLRNLVKRGLRGVRLITSDAYASRSLILAAIA